MAIIPNELQGISEDVPGLGQVPAADKTAIAAAGLGATAAQGSLQLLSEIKQTEAHDTAAKAYYGDIQASTDFLAKLKLRSPDGYIHKNDDASAPRVQNPDGTDRTMTQEFMEWSNDRYQKNQQDLPTELAQNIYKQRSGPYLNQETAVLQGQQHVRQVENFEVNQQAYVKQFRDELVSTPDLGKTYLHAQDLQKDVMSQVGPGKLYSLPEAKEKIAQTNSLLAESVMEGARSSILAPIRTKQPGFARADAINSWRQILAGEDATSKQRKDMGLPTIADMLAPDKKAEIDRQLIKMYELVKPHDLSDLNALTGEIDAALRNNKDVPNQVAYARSLIDKAIGEGKLSPVHQSQIEAGWMASYVIGRTIDNPAFQLATEDDRNQMAKDAYARAQGSAQQILGKSPQTEAMGTEAATTAKQLIDRANKEITSRSQTDFPDYIASVDKKGVGATVQKLDFMNPASFSNKQGLVQDMVQKTENYYKTMYPGHPEYWREAALSQDQSKTLAKRLTDPTLGTEATTLGIKSLQQAYGKYFPDLMDQMIKDGNLHEGWRYAAIVPQYLSSEDVVGALKGRDGALMKNFEVLYGEGVQGAGAKKVLDQAMSSDRVLKSYMFGQNQSNPNQQITEEQTHALEETVKTKAMQLYVQGAGHLTLTDAVTKASQALIGRNIKQIEVGGTSFFGLFGHSGTKSLLNLPVQMGDEKIGDLEAGKVKDYLNGHMSVDALKAFQIQAPPQANGKPSQFGEEFYKQVSSDMIYTVSANQRGFNLWWFDKDANKWVQSMAKSDDGKSVRPFFLPVEKALNGSK